MNHFFGREKELDWLTSLIDKDTSSLVVIRGRRRIGKSRLIDEFSKQIPSHIFSGLPPGPKTTRQSQLNTFCGQVAREFDLPRFQVADWGELFWQLGKRCQTGPMMIAFDEISWMGSKDPDFLGELKNAWDLYFSKNPELVFILCGSVSSWIEKNILSSTGFVGRIAVDLHLQELPLKNAVQFWKGAENRISPKEIFKVLCVTGGVPRYLEEVKPQLPAEDNIRRLCFDSRGLLFREFDQIFGDLFSSKAPTYTAIVESLADGPKHLADLSQTLLRPESTTFDHLKDLICAGFVTADPTWNLKTMKSSNIKKYRLSDNYLRFYLKYVRPHAETIEQDLHEWSPLITLPNWDTIIGLQFENLVLKNLKALLHAIGVNPGEVVHCGPYVRRSSKTAPGVQIDLLIQTRYHTLYLCEIKFLSKKVGMNTVAQVKEKQARLSLPRGWSLRPILIHVNGVTPEVLQSQTFDHIVDFSDLLDCTA